MRIRGIVRLATLEENPPGSDRVELVVSAQGVGPNQPRRIVIPYELLLHDPTLDPEHVIGKGFQAEVSDCGAGRWEAVEIQFASGRVLREPDG